MAKYCFYCGKELPAGERCRCKEPEKAASPGASGTRTGCGPASSAASGPKARSHTKTSYSRTSGKNNNRRVQNFIYRAGKIQQVFYRLRTFRDQVRTLFPNIFSGLASGIQYVTRPASKIRQESMRVSRPYSYVNIIAFSVLSGLLALLMSHSGSPLFTNLIALAFGSSQSLLFSDPFLSFVGLSVLAFLFVITMGLSFYIAARLSNRKPAFRKVIDLVSISLVYLTITESFVLVTILLGSRGSMSLIFVSLLLMGITHLLSFRNALGLTEDTVFFFLIFVYIVCYLLFSLLLNLAARLLIMM